METSLDQEIKTEEKQKIGGFLWAFPVLQFLLAIYFMAHIKRDVLPNVRNFSLLLDVKPSLVPVIIFEVISVVALFVLLVFSFVFFIKKNSNFKRLTIILIAYYAVFLIIDYFWFNALAEYATKQIAENFNAPYRKLIYRSLGIAVIFIPYLLISKRVKVTFKRT